MMSGITVRPIQPGEIDRVASLISAGYSDDIFFKWTVTSDADRHRIVTDYYKIYLRAAGCVAHVAESSSGELVGATVWLPHDVDTSIYDKIDSVVGVYADRFRAVADRSHLSEPPMTPFYQLVGVVVSKPARKSGIGAMLLKYQLDILDELGIPTYLEASTPYFGGGVYGKFGYRPVGELMVFTESAVLYPLWRPANKRQRVRFGGCDWRVLGKRGNSLLLLSENIIETAVYHNTFENTAWSVSDVRRYLNGEFYDRFSTHEQSQILEEKLLTHGNPWFTAGGRDSSLDKIFLMSVEEVLEYLGDSGQLCAPRVKFYIDDIHNENRRARLANGTPARWLLRTPGCSNDFVSVVMIDGRICVTGDFVNRASTELFSVGIRPAMWVRGDIMSYA